MNVVWGVAVWVGVAAVVIPAILFVVSEVLYRHERKQLQRRMAGRRGMLL